MHSSISATRGRGVPSCVRTGMPERQWALHRDRTVYSSGSMLANTESTLCDWVKDAAEMLVAVVAAMKTSVLVSHVAQSDDTGITALDKESVWVADLCL
jgi:hypothetical protein